MTNFLQFYLRISPSWIRNECGSGSTALKKPKDFRRSLSLHKITDLQYTASKLAGLFKNGYKNYF